MTKEYRIIPAGSCWETLDVTARKIILRSPTKRDLIHRTLEFAQKEDKCKVVVLNSKGYVEEERLLDNDPDKKLKDFLSLYYANLEPAYKEAVL